MSITKTKIVISGEDKTKQAFDSVKGNLNSIKTIGASIGGALGFAGGASIIGVLNKVVTETINAQNEQAQLAAVLRSTGEAAGFNADQLNKMASRISSSSIFSEGDITNAQTRLLSYTNIVGEKFPAAMQAVIDMSARMGVSLEQSAETIGRALDIPSQGLTALTRQGFRFTEAQKELVKQLEETGRSAEAQQIILDALETSYGGAAEAARNTLGGSLAALKNSFDDLFESNQSGGAFTIQIIKDITSAVDGLKGSMQGLDEYQPGMVAYRGAVNFQNDSRYIPDSYNNYRASIQDSLSQTQRGWMSGFSTLNNENQSRYSGERIQYDVPMLMDNSPSARLSEGISARATRFIDANPLRDAIAKQIEYQVKLREIKKLEDEGGLSAELAGRYRAQLYEQINRGAGRAADAVKKLTAEEQLSADLRKKEADSWAEIDRLISRSQDAELTSLEETSAAEISRREGLERQALAIKELFDPSLKLINIQQQYKNLLDEGLISQEEYDFALERSADSVSGFVDTSKEKFAGLKLAIEGFGNDSANALVDFAFKGETAVGDMVDTILRDLTRMTLKQGITDPLFKVFGEGLNGLLSFDGGGYTGGGSRSGGLDGKGGFLALMHPQESVIDHTRGSGSGSVSVMVNVNASGGDVSSNADFGKRLGNAIKQVVQQELINERRTGGALA